jgi:hypothetical protein
LLLLLLNWLGKKTVKKNMNQNLTNTLNELKDLINQLKTHADSNTAWTPTEKANLEKRISHLLDKSQPRHTNLTQDLDTDLKDLENIDKAIGQEKIRTDTEISKLTDEKTKLQADITAKEALIKQKNEEIGDKLTADLITKLDNLAQGVDKDGKVKIDETKLSEIKTIIEEVKTKGVSANLSDLTSKLDKLDSKAEEIKQGKGANSKNYWSIGACIGGGISVLLLGYLAFFKPNAKSSSPSKTDEE